MKTCFYCKQTLPRGAFNKQSQSIDGLQRQCRVCLQEYQRKYLVKLRSMYRSQKANSKHRNHPTPNYTWLEFYEWAESSGYAAIHTVWVKSGFEKRSAPSTDRIDNDLPYTLNNLQLVTWGDNHDKAGKDRKSGVLFCNHTPVTQYTLSGDFVATYHSQHEAHRVTGIPHGNIGNVCRKNGALTAGGFKWEYADG